jgi:hypothetical protein
LYGRVLIIVASLRAHQSVFGAWCCLRLSPERAANSLYRSLHTTVAAHAAAHLEKGHPLACALPAACRASLLSRAAAAAVALDPAAVSHLKPGAGALEGLDVLQLLGYLAGPTSPQQALLRGMSHTQVEAVLAALPGLWAKVRVQATLLQSCIEPWLWSRTCVCSLVDG